MRGATAPKGRDEREHIQKSRARPRQAFGCTGFTLIRKRHRLSRKQVSPTIQRSATTKQSDTAREQLKFSSTPNVDHLLELPMHIMDTALFYPSYMNLSDEQASAAMLPLIENVTRFGGVLTINWHDRSLGPERLWGDAYANFAPRLARPDALVCYSVANRLVVSQAARGIIRQRSLRMAEVSACRSAMDPTAADLPPLTLRVYNGASSSTTSCRTETRCSRTSQSTGRTRF